MGCVSDATLCRFSCSNGHLFVRSCASTRPSVVWECAFCVVYVRWCCVEYFVREYVIVAVNDCLCVYSFHVELNCFCCGVLWCCVYVMCVVVVVV